MIGDGLSKKANLIKYNDIFEVRKLHMYCVHTYTHTYMHAYIIILIVPFNLITQKVYSQVIMFDSRNDFSMLHM